MTASVFQRYDGKTWVTVAAPAAVMASPGSCAAFNGLVYCAFQGAGGQVTVATMAGKSWQPAMATIPGAVTPTSPALAVLGETLICVYQSNGSVHVSYLSAGGQWTADAFITLGDGQYLDGIYGSPALVVFSNTLFCLYQVYGHPGNLRVATYDGSAWVQVGGKNVNLPKVVPGMCFSPAAAVLGNKLYVLYQKYDGDGDTGNGTLTGTTFDGTTWASLGDIADNAMSASPAAVIGADGKLTVFVQGPDDNGQLGGMSTSDGENWEVCYAAQLELVSGTSPSVALVPAGSETWLLVNALADVQWPVYTPSTQMPAAAAQALLNTFSPVVYLSSLEMYFPCSVDWYLARSRLFHSNVLQISQPTAAQLPVQRYLDELSCLIPNQAGTTHTTFIQNHHYRLKISDNSAYFGMMPHPPATPQAPFYGAVIDNPAKNATDLLYMFCYGYNGMVGNDYIGFGVHQGDWEHVIIRLDRTQSRIVGVYCQAHASDDPFSTWYYPQGVDPDHYYTCFGSVNRPIIYSAAQSHASYTTPGEHPIGRGGWKGNDKTDQGWLWNYITNVIMVSMPQTPWLQFAGRWGGTASATASSPDPPAAQGWLIPRSDGPTG